MAILVLSARPPDRPTAVSPTAGPRCDPDNGGLVLPAGFCAVVVAEGVGAARHVVVSRDGNVYVAVAGRGGGVLALRDTNGDGKADVRHKVGREGGSGIALAEGALYFSTASTVYRYRLAAGQLAPLPDPTVIVRGMPTSGHDARSLVLSRDGRSLFVNIGSETNNCQEDDRATESRGKDPCMELNSRAGIWRFDANRVGQRQTDGMHYATGIRNAVALAIDPANRLYAVQHGRDELGQSWPKLYTLKQSAELPSEELLRVSERDDFGWPYCYHDGGAGRLVLGPEYGGDGARVGRCATKKAPLVAFPAHWAPNGLLFYAGTGFPARYRGGAFVAFHGSWNRAPYPQAGYRVVFVPFVDGRPSGAYETFADGFRSAGWSERRPVGLATGPDGSLYITDDAGGTIWRIIYRGGNGR